MLMLADIPLSRQRVLLGDLKAALLQQMFFWGRDVMAGGNLLTAHGFMKLPSLGLKGTSCYRLDYHDGVIELHGACAGWYPHNGCTPLPRWDRAHNAPDRCFAKNPPPPHHAMPTYLYETIPPTANEEQRRFELRQSMKDPALTHDPESGLPVRRIIQGGYLSGVKSTASNASCCATSGCGCD